MAGELTGRPRKKGSVEKMNWKSIAEYATQITMSDKNTDVLARDAVAKKLVPMMVVGGVLGLLATAVMMGASIAAMGASPFSPRIERMQTYAGWAVFALGAVTTWGLGVIGARMRRVVRRVQIDRDAPRPPVQTAAMPRDDPRGQLVRHAKIERAAVDRVLEPRQRTAATKQALARNRVSVEQQLVDGVVGDDGRHHCSRDGRRRCQRCAGRSGPRASAGYSVRRPLVEQTPGERLDQAVDALGGLQQDRPAVGTGLLLV